MSTPRANRRSRGRRSRGPRGAARLGDVEFWSGTFQASMSWALFENGSAVVLPGGKTADEVANCAIASLAETERCRDTPRAAIRGADWIIGPFCADRTGAAAYVRITARDAGATSALGAIAAAQNIMAEDRDTLGIVHVVAR